MNAGAMSPRMLRRLALLVVVAGAIAPAASVNAQRAFARWATSQVVIYINPQNAIVGGSAAEAVVLAAMDVWSGVPGSSFEYTYGGQVTDTTTTYDNRNVVIFRRQSQGSATASTYTWISRGTVVDSDVVVWQPVDKVPGTCASAASLPNVAARELGFALGLDESNAIDPSQGICGAGRRKLSDIEVAALTALYPAQRQPAREVMVPLPVFPGDTPPPTEDQDDPADALEVSPSTETTAATSTKSDSASSRDVATGDTSAPGASTSHSTGNNGHAEPTEVAFVQGPTTTMSSASATSTTARSMPSPDASKTRSSTGVSQAPSTSNEKASSETAARVQETPTATRPRTTGDPGTLTRTANVDTSSATAPAKRAAPPEAVRAQARTSSPVPVDESEPGNAMTAAPTSASHATAPTIDAPPAPAAPAAPAVPAAEITRRQTPNAAASNNQFVNVAQRTTIASDAMIHPTAVTESPATALSAAAPSGTTSLRTTDVRSTRVTRYTRGPAVKPRRIIAPRRRHRPARVWRPHRPIHRLR